MIRYRADALDQSGVLLRRRRRVRHADNEIDGRNCRYRRGAGLAVDFCRFHRFGNNNTDTPGSSTPASCVRDTTRRVYIHIRDATGNRYCHIARVRNIVGGDNARAFSGGQPASGDTALFNKIYRQSREFPQRHPASDIYIERER